MNVNDKTRLLAALLLFVVLLAGCSVRKEMDPVEAPEATAEDFSISGSEAIPDKWWLAFDDSELNQVIDRALDDNLNLKQAWNRLSQVRAIARVSESFKLPSVEASASGQRQRSGQPGFNPSTFSPSKTIDSFNVSVTASYQVDIWNRIGASAQADILTISATRKDVEATASAIVSSIAEIWYSIAEQQVVIDLLKAQLKVNEDFLKLVELRFSQGNASALDVFQQRLQLEATRNQLAPAQTTVKVLKHQLAVLLGEQPGAEIPLPRKKLPELPGLPGTGLPADLLRNRPDIRAAEYRIYAADRRVAAAIADQFPSLGISSSGGAFANDIADLFDRWFVNIAGNILGTIFDGGRKDSAVEQAEAGLRDSLLSWKLAILNGIREVEDALAREQGNEQVLRGIEKQLELARQTLEQSRRRYVNGLTNYLNVLSSLQALQQLERAEVSARKRVLSNRINLYVALGGDWTGELAEPDLSSITNKETNND